MSGLLGPLAAFIAVLAMIPIALWLLKRTPLGANASMPSTLRVIGSVGVGTNQRLITVEVGSGDERRWLVLGVTPGSINTLHSLPPQALPEAGAPGAGSPFARLMAAARRGKPGDNDAR